VLLEKENNRVVSQKEIKTVAILTTDEISNWVNVKEEVEKLFNIRNAKIYSFRPHKKNQEISYKHFSEIDFSWSGDISQPNFKNFIDEPFDLLIGYFSTKNWYLENAVLRSSATFKVGISNVNQQLYDIEIAEVPMKTDAFLSELKKYLKILKKIKI
jgi:acetolactate synthase small subunit